MIVPRCIYESKILKMQRSDGDFIGQLTDEYNKLIPHLPDECQTIWDVGAGFAGIDVFLSKHYKNDPELYLTDFNKTDQNIFYGFNPGGYCAYNSFDIAKELLETNGVKNYYFDDLNGVRNIPASADIILSLLSCGFHYPVSTYQNDFIIRSHLRTVLILDIRKGEENQIEFLQSYFNTISFNDHGKWFRYIGVRK